MAGEVLANESRLDFHRIDLRQVVSKYMGETGKNLRRVFDTAEDGGMILFFDKANALFGKSTEIRDMHDRFANRETNYLLEAIESYQGIALLATNKKENVDTAFIRRLRYVLEFRKPGAGQRLCIWLQLTNLQGRILLVRFCQTPKPLQASRLR